MVKASKPGDGEEVQDFLGAFGFDGRALQSFTLEMNPDEVVLISTTEIVQKGTLKQAIKTLNKRYTLVELPENIDHTQIVGFEAILKDKRSLNGSH